jgi:acyl-coenzyme A thioesterase PaaI-like protein
MKIIQSNTHHCFVCGIDNPYGLKIEFTSNGDGKVTAKKTFPQAYQGYPGIVHGGVLAAVLDEAAGRATMKDIRPEVALVTGKLSVRYRKPVRVNEEIYIEGTVNGHSGKIYQCRSTISSINGEILAEAEVTLVEPGNDLISQIAVGNDQWIDHVDSEVENDR